MILLPLCILAFAVGAADLPCVDGVLQGPDTALVGMRQPEHTRAVVCNREDVVRNYAARVDWNPDVPHRGLSLSRGPRTTEGAP